MRVTTRTILALTLTIGGALAAQETATPGPSSPAAEREATAAERSTTAAERSRTAETAGTTTGAENPADAAAPAENEERPANASQVRSEFTSLLSQGPPEFPTILTLDPTLLSDAAFMTRYPRLAQFVAEHPEVRHHPRYYLSAFAEAPPRNSALEEILEPFLILAVFTLIAVALSWLVRTIIEQKRWNRLSRTQSEVHNKILDRFGTSAEVLDYIRTPAGSKFLESAPIPLHTEPAAPRSNAMPRVVWTIQIGVIIAAAALGMLLVSLRFSDETGNGLFALGVIALCIGLGFTGSAAVSIFLSRRLGMFDLPPAGEHANDSGVMK